VIRVARMAVAQPVPPATAHDDHHTDGSSDEGRR